jgi:hypothetical protein
MVPYGFPTPTQKETAWSIGHMLGPPQRLSITSVFSSLYGILNVGKKSNQFYSLVRNHAMHLLSLVGPGYQVGKSCKLNLSWVVIGEPGS